MNQMGGSKEISKRTTSSAPIHSVLKVAEQKPYGFQSLVLGKKLDPRSGYHWGEFALFESYNSTYYAVRFDFSSSPLLFIVSL